MKDEGHRMKDFLWMKDEGHCLDKGLRTQD